TGRNDIKIFQDGVDPDSFNLPTKTKKSKNPTILFGVSNMKWMQNRDSTKLILEKYWPSIKKKYPDCQLYIVGRHAPAFYGDYQSADIIVTEADTEGGPKDPQYYYEYCWLLLAPMESGGGTRNKFLEGMTFGLPVITTPEGGMGNIEITNYKHAIVCPANEILKNVYNLVDNSSYRRNMGQMARNLIQSRYSFDRCVDGLNQIYEKIAKK
ncbi:MAG: glycosyltransferase, partial [Candidatus Shapirobacteria bacterium]